MSNLHNIPKIYSDPIISRRRLGTPAQPFIHIKESLTVEKHYVILSEIPNDYDRVKVKKGSLEYYETKENEYLEKNMYWVDYVGGIVYFHESLHGKTLDFEYTGEGVHLYPDSRVYLTSDKSFPNIRDKFVDVDRAILVERHRIDEQIMSHPQPSEVVDTRIDYNGKIFRVAKDRIDSEQRKIEAAYVDAYDVKHESLKKRIDSMQLVTDKKIDDLTGETVELQSQIDIIPGRITAKVQELRESVDGEFSYAYSLLDMLTDEMTLKVDVNGVISSINLSKEGVRIDGANIWLTGETVIDDAVIKSANIESLEADKIKVGVLDGHTLKGGKIFGGRIEQSSGKKNLVMSNGELSSYYEDDLSMKFGQYSLDFYNKSSDFIGSFGTAFQNNDSSIKGLALTIEKDFFNIGVRRQGLIRPVFRASVESKITSVSGVFNSASEGSSLHLYANRRLVSDDVDYEKDASAIDQPSIIMSQGSGKNTMRQYFGGMNARKSATWQVRWRESADNSVRRIEANNKGVHLSGRVTGNSSSTGNILGKRGNAYYENNTGSNTLSKTSALRANGIRSLSGSGKVNFYIGVRGGGEVRITNGNGRNGGSGIVYRNIRARKFITSSSREYKTEIKDFKESALSLLDELNVVSYKFKDDVKRLGDGATTTVGLIAEDSAFVAAEDKRAIDNYKLTTLNTKGIQELSKKDEDKDLKIKTLESKVLMLEKQIDNIKKKGV